MSKFCPECGTRLSEPNPKFCPECGANLGPQEARPVEAAKAISHPPSPDARPSVHEDVEMRKVSAYLTGQTGTMEFATTMEKMRLQRSTQQVPAMET